MTRLLSKYILVFIGGGMGAVCRYGLSGLVQRFSNGEFPFGTMTVNVLGSAIIGLVMSLSERYLSISPAVRLFLTVGALGGFTTYSTFSYETIALVQDGGMMAAAFNVVGTVCGCLAGAWLGIVLGRAM